MKRPEDWLMAKAFNLYSDLVPEPRAYLEMMFSKDISKNSITAMAVYGWCNHLPLPNVWNLVWGRMNSLYQNISWVAWTFLSGITFSFRNCLSHVPLLSCKAWYLIANLILQSLKRGCSIWMAYLHQGSFGFQESCITHVENDFFISYHLTTALFIFQCFTDSASLLLFMCSMDACVFTRCWL